MLGVMRYLKAYVISAPILGVVYHVVAAFGPNPMAWWPDTFIFGGFMGLLAALVLMRLTMFGAAAKLLRSATRSVDSRPRL